jgi:hypothetical protein
MPTHLDDRDLGWCDPDFVFAARLRDGAGSVVFVLEHQSEPDSEMPYRMARASVALLSPAHKDPATGRRAMVMPVVLAHGRRRWNVSTRLRSLMDGVSAVPSRDSGLVLQQSFVLCDLNRMRSDPVLGFPVSAATRLFLFVLRGAMKRGFVKKLEGKKSLFEELGREPDALQVLSNLVWYMRKVVPDMAGEISERVREWTGIGSELWKPIPGTWEWRDLQESRAEGRAEGRADGARRTLSRQIVKRFGSLPSDLLETLNTATLEQIDVWAERFVDARSRDEVFC